MLMGLDKRESLVAITKVWIEKGCITCGLSESNCPEVFKVKHGKWVKGATVIEGVDYSGLEEKIKQAAEGFPVEVIKYDEDDDLKMPCHQLIEVWVVGTKRRNG